MSPYLHLRRDGQSSHLHGQPRLADLDELVEAERLLEILPRSVRLPLLLGSQRRRLQHKGHKGRTALVTRASNQTKVREEFTITELTLNNDCLLSRLASCLSCTDITLVCRAGDGPGDSVVLLL